MEDQQPTQSTLALEKLKAVVASFNASDSQDAQSSTRESTKEYIDQLKQTKELEALKQRLADKEQELKQKEEFLEARNIHIIQKAKSRQVDLDGDGVKDVEVMVDEQGNIIKGSTPKLINPEYKGDITQLQSIPPEYKDQTENVINQLSGFLGTTKVTLDNISSLVSQSMVYASDFTDLSGSKKKTVVLSALGNIAITQANSPYDAQLNAEFVSRSAGTFIDTLYAANKRDVVYASEHKIKPIEKDATQLQQLQSLKETPGDNVKETIMNIVAGKEKIHKGMSMFGCCSSQSAE